MYDLIIIGGGPAGLTAGIYSARYKLNALILTAKPGGQMTEAHKIENWPGTESISGLELAKKLEGHAKKLGTKIKRAEVIDVKKNNGPFLVTTSEGERYEGISLILALGTEKRKLDIPGEDKYSGKGVSRCAICDAPLFKDKTVAVVGGSNAAAHSALLLVKYAKKVYIIYRKEAIRPDPLLEEELKGNKKIEIINNRQVKEIKGNKFIEHALLDNGENLKLEGLFIEIGGIPYAVIAKKLGIELDNDSFIIVDKAQSTNIKGVFAAGDITTGSNKLMQVITAAAEGAIAATSAYKFVKEQKK